jgi:hypothetical protein
MYDQPQDPDELLAEAEMNHILEMSDDEVIQEIRASGRDPDKLVKETREVIASAVRKYRNEH